MLIILCGYDDMRIGGDGRERLEELIFDTSKRSRKRLAVETMLVYVFVRNN